jgi:osmotically-inducible protein OsmY
MSPHQELGSVIGQTNPFATLFREIAETAERALHKSPYLELRNISCRFSSGVLTLDGWVPSYHLKQLAQASVVDVPGVIEVHNRLEVGPSLPGHNRGRMRRDAIATAQAD